MAGELGISKSAYSKIERGVTDPSVGRITAIAKILEVEVTYFFQEQTTLVNKIEDPATPFGFATKSEVDELARAITKLKQELTVLKAILPKPMVKKKK